jgi:Protein of unknown function (DUF4232)
MAKHLQMRLAFGTAVIATSVGLVACGGGSSKPRAGSTATAALPAATTATTNAAPKSATTTTTTAAAGQRRCRAADLALRFLGQQGATGRGELGFALRNTTGTSCRTFGYPGVLFLDRAGGALPTTPVRRTHDPFGQAPLTSLVVAPGASVSFRLGVTHGIASSIGCTTAYGLQVIPPDDTQSIRTTIPGGAYECRQATVTPLRPGTSAYP